MVNEIKFDISNHITVPKKSIKDPRISDNHQTPSPDMDTVTNTLGTLVNKLLAENSSTPQTQRIAELKDQIANKLYNVDIDMLASKLTHTLLNTK